MTSNRPSRGRSAIRPARPGYGVKIKLGTRQPSRSLSRSQRNRLRAPRSKKKNKAVLHKKLHKSASQHSSIYPLTKRSPALKRSRSALKRSTKKNPRDAKRSSSKKRDKKKHSSKKNHRRSTLLRERQQLYRRELDGYATTIQTSFRRHKAELRVQAMRALDGLQVNWKPMMRCTKDGDVVDKLKRTSHCVRVPMIKRDRKNRLYQSTTLPHVRVNAKLLQVNTHLPGDIVPFLDKIGMSMYRNKFLRNDIDTVELAAMLRKSDLKEDLNISKREHRVIIHDALKIDQDAATRGLSWACDRCERLNGPHISNSSHTKCRICGFHRSGSKKGKGRDPKDIVWSCVFCGTNHWTDKHSKCKVCENRDTLSEIEARRTREQRLTESMARHRFDKFKDDELVDRVGCPTCGHENKRKHRRCKRCKRELDKKEFLVATINKKNSKTDAAPSKKKATDWDCEVCQFVNPKSARACKACKRSRFPSAPTLATKLLSGWGTFLGLPSAARAESLPRRPRPRSLSPNARLSKSKTASATKKKKKTLPSTESSVSTNSGHNKSFRPKSWSVNRKRDSSLKPKATRHRSMERKHVSWDGRRRHRSLDRNSKKTHQRRGRSLERSRSLEKKTSKQAKPTNKRTSMRKPPVVKKWGLFK